MYGFFLLFRCSISSFSKLLLIKNIFILDFPNLLCYWQLLHKVLSNFFFLGGGGGGWRELELQLQLQLCVAFTCSIKESSYELANGGELSALKTKQ